ncbi:MAG: PEP-CTERM sorting domain-containing protein [Puniceicoccales bacterium]
MNKLLLLSAASAIAATNAHAILEVYYDLDATTSLGAKLTPTGGEQAGDLTTTLTYFDASFESETSLTIAGTSDNIPTGFSSPDNRAIGFYRLGTVYAEGSYVMSGFDFSERTDVSLSFAYRSGEAFSWANNLTVEYSLDNGANWSTVGIGINDVEYETSDSWEVASVSLPAAVQADGVDLRIHTITWATVASYLDLDNVQVTSVPEPSTWALIAGIGVLGLATLRRSRKKG